MPAKPNDQLIPRAQIMERLNVSDSTERRNRQSGKSWPAHVRVGGRILYRESSVNAWIADQEGISVEVRAARAGGYSPKVEAAIERRALELASLAPRITARQIAQLRETFGRPARPDNL